MKPEEASQLLDGITPPPWEFDSSTYQEVDCPEVTEFWATGRYDVQIAEQDATEEHRESTEKDFTLIASAPGMAAMIANMTAEYAVQLADGKLVGTGWGTYETAEFDRNEWRRDGYNANIAVRYVTAPQPLGEEQVSR